MYSLVSSPQSVARPFRTFKTRLELLQVLCDAVKAHRSLFQDAGILYQDVSAHNNIIKDGQSPQSSREIMIDLDVAQNLTEGQRTPGEVTDTRPFMSIDILNCRLHGYRQDLESFLYILPSLKSVAEEMRQWLFPIQDGALWTRIIARRRL